MIMHKTLAQKGEYAVWEIGEDLDFYQQRLDLNPEENAIVSSLKGRRKLEWLASRYLLHHMSGREKRAILEKDPFGKPHLIDSEFEISLSHCWDKVAVIAAPRIVGIDIQRQVEKIGRIDKKFLSDKELESIHDETRIEQLHVCWGAKESVYKAYGQRALEFKEHIHLDPFEFKIGESFKARLKKDDYSMDFNVHYEILDDYYIVYVIQS